VLLIALRGLPHAFRRVHAADGDALSLHVTGAAGGRFTLRRFGGQWTIWQGAEPAAVASITVSDDTAWRLLFNGLPPHGARQLCSVSGDRSLYEQFFRARSVIV
jgi:hypothetical protein